MRPDDVANVAGYALKLDGVTAAAGAEFSRNGGAIRGQSTVARG